MSLVFRDEDGLTYVTCPFCARTGFLGEAPNGCDHFVTGDGMDGLFGLTDTSAESLPKRIGSLADRFTREALDDAPEQVRVDLLRALEDSRWWDDDPELVCTDAVEIDEASGSWEYWDWFHPDPAFRERIEARADAAILWLDDTFGRDE